MRLMRYLFLSALFVMSAHATQPADVQGSPQGFLHAEKNRNAFAMPAPALDSAQLRVFNFGNRLFNTNWVQAPASAQAFDGLGPTFNRVSCSSCHVRDGRGRAPEGPDEAPSSMVMRISLPGAEGAPPRPVPGYGDQINDRAVVGVVAEATVRVRWREHEGQYADGSPYRLRQPQWQLSNASYGALPKRMLRSARVAPAVFGMGLIESVPEAEILRRADPSDVDGDGISGRPNWVDSRLLGKRVLGRFGWKAGIASLHEQNVGAALADIGLSSSLFPDQNCPPGQRACRAAISGGEPEVTDQFAEKLTAYVRMLGVPAARTNATHRNGAALFRTFGCQSCHTETLRTDQSASLAHLQDQEFSAYTDLLLHDMGEGLADQRPEFSANGREWRTAPLWGIGLQQSVNGHTEFLHDGRARSLAEAILWHGGEAERSKQKFRRADAEQRQALIAFLESL